MSYAERIHKYNIEKQKKIKSPEFALMTPEQRTEEFKKTRQEMEGVNMGFNIILKVSDRVIVIPVFDDDLVDTLRTLRTATSEDGKIDITIVPIFD